LTDLNTSSTSTTHYYFLWKKYIIGD
jgi:hypothetical protein